MKAWQFVGVNEPLIRNELPDPEAGQGEIVIDIKAAGLCHSDVSYIDGTLTSLLAHIPIVLGHEIAGIVSAVGSGVTDFSVGQRVGIPATVDSPGTARNGGFADKVVAVAGQCVHLPDAVAFEQAAPAMDAARTAYRGLVTAGHVVAGMTVGIIGFGGLGSLAVQIAHEIGAIIYVAEVNEAAWDEARKQGARDVAADIREFEDKGLDVIVDFAGYGTTTAAAIDAVRPQGRVVQVGLAREMATISAQKITMKEITYIGAANGDKSEAEAVLALMASGNIKSDVLPITFDEIPDCLKKLELGGVRGRYVALAQPASDDKPGS
ncbi:propanol-preferring alcohol dehydrogenase [Erwinia toletana]|uniref:alcohol dehydrogenase n=1 Tax=Winslowiella toletana TaxID=92490 RepID=A0ABS4PFF4_9GAMM|nr:zinc-binding dehydrogenase [Winslowiella toletana]MBP2170801.1 propanol-preferring alcohol dehydrogenase [Winslowiella toletana]